MSTGHRWLIVGFLALVAVVIVVKLQSLPPNLHKLLAAEDLAFLHQELQALETAKVQLERDRLRLDAERIQDAIEHVGFWREVFVYASVVLAGAAGGGILIASVFFGWGRIRQQSLVPQVIGESTLTVHYRTVRDPAFARMLSEVTLIEGVRAQFPEKAADLAVQFLRNMPRTGRTVFPALPAADHMIDVTPDVQSPTFHDLWTQGTMTPGSPLCMGFTGHTPQYRQLEDIKALSVAGWQGSGKTLSIGYLATCLLLQYPQSQGYIVDPHRGHTESLGALLKPLEATGRLMIVNPLDLPDTMRTLTRLLDARLSGAVSSQPLVFIIIDELSRLGKLDIFHEHVLPFIERCTEETRKANILFIGSGQKWQARHFGHKADIRQAMPSLLVHKTKPSQAELLLEGSSREEKNLVKQLTEPGQALLSTSHDADPVVVKMPLITKADIQHVSQFLQVNGPSIDVNPLVNSDVNLDVNRADPLAIDMPAIDRIDSKKSGELTDQDLLDWLCQSALSQKEFCERYAIDTGLFSRYKSKGKLTETMREALLMERRKKIIDLNSRRKHHEYQDPTH